jgi:phospholipid-translocating ATPase
MFFRKCTIGGKVYDGKIERDTGKESKELPPAYKETDTVLDNSPRAPLGGYQTSHTRTDSGSTAVPLPSPDLDLPGSDAELAGKHFYDANLARDLVDAANVEPGSPQAAHARNLNAFLTILALCHTVIASVNPETHAIEYKAQSPDEAALVQAAADMGYVFRGRDHEVLTLQKSFSINEYGGEMVERYELLNILEFSSARKRMSVIVKQMDEMGEGKIFLLTKGADNVIFERLKTNSTPEADILRQTTEQHLDQFATQGLRTLTLAYKYIEGTVLHYSVFLRCISDNVNRGRIRGLESEIP